MSKPIKATAAMIVGMAPVRQPGVYVFCTTRDEARLAQALPQALGLFREVEGASLILPVVAAGELGFPVDQPMAQITLSVHSALDGVGLTAAVAGALAAENIPCNMVAAFHHDHVFVPLGLGDRALAVLTELAGGVE